MNHTQKQSLLHDHEGNYFLVPFILVTSLFFFWGVANNMTDTLLAAFKNIMEMTDFQTSFIQLAFYGAYAVFAIPAALIIRKFNFKTGIIVGLAMYAGGTFLFYPAAQLSSYGFYLFAIYVMAGGCSILETTANPYILSMGRPENMTRRLNLAQSFNPIGSISGIILSQIFILSQLSANKSEMTSEMLAEAQSRELSAVTLTYMGVGAALLVVLLIILFYKKMPAAKDKTQLAFGKTVGHIFKNRLYSFGVITQFFYVGAQIGVWSYTIRYVMKALNLVDPVTDQIVVENVAAFMQQYPGWSSLWNFDAATTAENIGNSFYLTSILLFSASRFIFTALMKYIKPGGLLGIAAVGATLSTFAAIFFSGMSGVIGLMMISFFMSLMFPTIYGIALEKLSPTETKVGGSFLVMAILGGALLTSLQGYLSTLFANVALSYTVPVVCFVVVGLYGFLSHKMTQKTSTEI